MSFGGRNKTPCKYFQQGRCKKGNSCNFAHVYVNNNGNGNGGNNSGLDRYQNFINATNLGKYAKEVEDDMTMASELKFQPLTSSYSLGNPCAVNLIQDRDLSAEESRFLFYQLQLQNSLPVYETQMQARAADSVKCRNFVAADSRKAARFLQLATEKMHEGGTPLSRGFIEHPLDLTGTSYSNKATSAGTSNLFGSTTTPQNPFGQQPSIAPQQAPFGIPSAPPATGAFGQPGFGSSGISGAFGQPKFGASGAGAFGTGTANAFGSPSSTFGAKPVSTAFGSGAGAFGSKPAPSGFGAGANAFGSGASAFGGQPASNPASNSVFGAPAFASGSNGSSAFGKATFGSTSAPQAPAFGSSAFNPGSAGSQVSSSPFGGSVLGKPTFGSNSGNSPFASIQNPQSASPFGSVANQTNSTTSTSPFGNLNAQQNTTKPADAIKPSGFGQTFGAGGFSSNTPAGSPFGATPTNNTMVQNIQPQNSSFSNPSINQQPFVQGVAAQEELSEADLPKEVLDYFKAERFQLGKVPDVAPPAVLIN
ncbi:LAME_0E03642g1_1 [Lachancea meyersii CBS 8951]|uniref:LAME_0E03642g1_1 n=1 Tax=Lachancea meyersii CBS 8951 TaxID=1266667 RepID=A0A1G4JGI1_9SACH|nr:LAME_0E03642g1_1 [Lachancea meyersii CBS 8951]